MNSILNLILFLLGCFISVAIFILPPLFMFRHASKIEKYYREHPEIEKIELDKRALNNKKKIKFVNEILYPLFGIFSLLIAIGVPLLVLGYQILNYLKTGVWNSLSVIDVMKYCNIHWAFTPQDWFGLWYIFNAINISFPVFVLFILILFAIISDKNNHHS